MERAFVCGVCVCECVCVCVCERERVCRERDMSEARLLVHFLEKNVGDREFMCV